VQAWHMHDMHVKCCKLVNKCCGKLCAAAHAGRRPAFAQAASPQSYIFSLKYGPAAAAS
jgi:hypothetical protein